MTALVARVYGALVALRNAGFDRGWREPEVAPIPVISVGNLGVGGNGKTPLVAWLARLLVEAGERPVLVSRGYAGRREDDPMVAATAEGPVAGVSEVGDEAVWLARATGAAVVVGRVRAEAIRWALAVLAPLPTVAVLDDGFQHRALARDLDLVLVDARDPFPGGALLPAGRLREPPAALDRADLVLVHRGHVLALAPASAALEPWLGRAVEVAVRPVRLRALGPTPAGEETLESLRGARVHLAAGIARPERFRALVEALGATVVGETFVRDHASLDPGRLSAQARAGRVLVTAKDAVKLPALLPGVQVLEQEQVVLAGRARLEAAVLRACGGQGR